MIESAVRGFRMPLEAARLLLRERRLWTLALFPMALSFVALALAGGFVIAHAAELYDWTTQWIPSLEATRWYAWLWVGPAKVALRSVGVLLFLGLAVASLVAALLVASLLAAPFHDALAYRVEEIVTGRVVDESAAGVRGLLGEAGRSLLEEARRMAFFLSVVVPLGLVGFVLPGAHLLTGPAIVAFTIFFLPLDYASYALDRRHVRFAEKRRWVLDQAPLMAGFGSAAFLACSVPVLNIAAMPLLVVAGTLMVIRYAREAAWDGTEAGSESPR